jgi:hypothetical protein
MVSKICLLLLLSFLSSCQGVQKTDLVFSDLANNTNASSPLDDLDIPSPGASSERKADISLVMVDRHFLLNKFIDLFELPVTEYPLTGTSAGITNLASNSLYDKIMPSLMWYGFMGSGCDLYASTNVWPHRTIYDPASQRDNWHESCFFYHRYSLNAQASSDVVASVSTSPRWAINSRICHQLVEARGDKFLFNKMNFDLNNLPELSPEDLERVMEIFMPSYTPSDAELQALLNFSDLYPIPRSNAQKLTIWKNVVEAVCQSPFWHVP